MSNDVLIFSEKGKFVGIPHKFLGNFIEISAKRRGQRPVDVCRFEEISSKFEPNFLKKENYGGGLKTSKRHSLGVIFHFALSNKLL